MKTTIEIADPVFRQIKARAALKGKSLRSFLLEAIREKLEAEAGVRRPATGWRAVFGRGPKRSLAQLEAAIDREFSKIRPEDWT
jgi:hypothetical protein